MNARHLPFLFASVLLTACGSVVTDGGGSSGDPNNNNLNPPGDETTTTSGAGPETPVQYADAITRAQNDILWEEYWANHDSSGGSTSSGGGGDLDPNDLFLRVSDMGVSCESPTVELPCGSHYQLSIGVPPTLQQVGIYDLEDPQLILYSGMSETGEPYSPDPGDCSWGGGSLGAGTLEILSIDANEVHFKVTMTDGLWSSDPSGDYVALRCPSAQ